MGTNKGLSTDNNLLEPTESSDSGIKILSKDAE
jgi:hypothetical protein